MIKLKNNTQDEIILEGNRIAENESLELQDVDLQFWGNSSQTIQLLADESLILELNDVEVSDLNKAVNILKSKLVTIDQPKDSENYPVLKLHAFSDAVGFRFRGVSFSTTADANTTHTFDYELTEERWINGGRLLIDNIGEDDQVTFEVVDKDNIFGFGINTVLDRFIDEFFIPQDGNLEVALSYPARLIQGLYLRMKYTSTHASGCKIKCNLYLHKKE